MHSQKRWFLLLMGMLGLLAGCQPDRGEIYLLTEEARQKFPARYRSQPDTLVTVDSTVDGVDTFYEIGQPIDSFIFERKYDNYPEENPTMYFFEEVKKEYKTADGTRKSYFAMATRGEDLSGNGDGYLLFSVGGIREYEMGIDFRSLTISDNDQIVKPLVFDDYGSKKYAVTYNRIKGIKRIEYQYKNKKAAWICLN